MDAASCVGVAPAALLSSSSFADSAAIARALHFSLCDYSPLPTTDPPPHTHHPVAATTDVDLGTCNHPVAVASEHVVVTHRSSQSPSGRCPLGPSSGGRAGKRRPRPSKRVPTTYISTDAATFRLMVQQVTGAQLEPHRDDDASSCLGLLMTPQPPFDVVVDPAPLLPADSAGAHVAAYIPHHLHAAAAAAAAVTEQPCFPTLDSWNVMYGKDEVV